MGDRITEIRDRLKEQADDDRQALDWLQHAAASGGSQMNGKEIVGTVFQNTSASHDILERVMIERIDRALEQLKQLLNGQWQAGQYALSVNGDGATCIVVPRCDLHNTLHALMCACGSEWDACETEGVSATCETLDDEDYWTHPYPDYKGFQWTFRDGEECPITVTRLTMPEPPAGEKPQEDVP